MPEAHRFSLQRIAQAATIIDPVFLNSPQYLAESLGQRFGCRLGWVVLAPLAGPAGGHAGPVGGWLLAGGGGARGQGAPPALPDDRRGRLGHAAHGGIVEVGPGFTTGGGGPDRGRSGVERA